jgi:CheY-like chemotaxis protein
MSSTVHNPRKVLMIEDNVDDEHLALRAFSHCEVPVEVNIVHDGLEVLRLLGLSGVNEPFLNDLPDLVLCDLKLPVVKGDEVLERVRKEPRLDQVPFVMFSSSDETSDVERCMSLGATAYCVKPIDYRQFITCIQEVLQTYLPGYADASEPSCLVASAQVL